MAKELLIVFVYDTERCQREEDDPNNAVVYFYPSWVSEQQRLALCGQLMGVTQFISSSFTPPNIMSLQSGKFAVRTIGHYILCVGTDRNIPDIVLETRIDTLDRLLRFYHRDFDTLFELYTNDFLEKLNQVFETYLPILHFAGNIFGSIPQFHLPKSASNVFLKAMQILQCFQDKPGVLGGVLLYQNKVVSTQFSCQLTKQLVITDPYRVKVPAETVSTQFHLPVGVQLLTVYVDKKELSSLAEESEQLSAALLCADKYRQENNLKQNMAKSNPLKEPPLPPFCGMKRDVSRIFTVPEEDGEIESDGKEKVPDVVKDAVEARRAVRLQSVAPASFVVPDQPQDKIRAKTTENISENVTHIVPMRYYSLGLPSMNSEWCDQPQKDYLSKPYYNTISDPVYPLFRRDGLPASHSLYEARLARHYHQLNTQSNSGKKLRPKSISISVGGGLQSTGGKERAKRALNLPLKSSITEQNDMMPLTDFGKKSTKPPIPLTPLMAKLSLLAMEQKHQVTTPSIEKLPSTPATNKIKTQQKEVEVVELKETVLYVCGYQDTTLILLMEGDKSQDPDHIHTLWQTSISSLSELEQHLHHCLDHFPQNNTSSGPGVDSYSFLCVDPDYGTVQRGGTWAGTRLELLTLMYDNFTKLPQLTDLVVRSEGNLIYGYQCGHNQVFYQQACNGNECGLPTPSDLMGVVPLKAKRRLERDHGIVLL